MTRTNLDRRSTDALMAKLVVYLGELESAFLARNSLRVTALLRRRMATHLPREVREELMVLSRAPRDSLRAPVQFYRFGHRMAQLAAGGERLLAAQTELRLDPRVGGAARRRARAAAARDPAEAEKDD
jgi:hypothetical protein